MKKGLGLKFPYQAVLSSNNGESNEKEHWILIGKWANTVIEGTEIK